MLLLKSATYTGWSKRPSGGTSIQQRYMGSQWESSFLAAARPFIFFDVTMQSCYGGKDPVSRFSQY